ncbi:MAG: hypothetical protein J7K68_00195 [Candidatus Diapherotrites archaeon]|nr:hypothetical protein [Candidatus Diapherotrites archaeon]
MRRKTIAGTITYVVLLALSFFLLSTIGITLPKIVDINALFSIFKDNILYIIGALVTNGLGLGVLFASMKTEKRNVAAILSFISSLFVVSLFILSFQDMLLEYLIIGILFSISVAIATAIISGTPKERGVGILSFGFNATKKAYFIFAVILFISTFAIVSMDSKPYEDSFKNSLKTIIRQSGSFEITRDQIRAMVDAQASNNQAIMRQMIENMDFTIVREQIRRTYGPIYEQMGLNLTDEEVDRIYNEVNSPEAINARKQAMLENIGSLQYNKEALVSKLYQQLNAPERKEEMMRTAENLIDTLPMLQTVYKWMNLIVAFALASIVLALESFIIAPASALGSGIAFSVMRAFEKPSKKEEALEEASWGKVEE